MKKLLRYILYALTALILAIFLLPVLFKEELIRELEQLINKQINAQVQFEDVKLSLIRDFPRVHTEFLLTEVTGNDGFNDVVLLKANNISISTDLKSLIRSNKGINIKRFSIEEAELNLIVDALGDNNYNIVKSDPNESNGSKYSGEIDRYEFSNCHINYIDAESDIRFHALIKNHVGKGQFNQDAFDLVTKSEVEDMSISYDGIDYYNGMSLYSDMNLLIDNKNSVYTIKENNSKLNELILQLEGSLQFLDNAYLVDCQATSMDSDIKQILSIIPGVYQENMNQFSTKGQSDLKLQLIGKYDALANTYPSIEFNSTINNGVLVNTKNNMALDDIEMQFDLNASEGDWTDAVIDIQNMSLRSGKDRLSGRCKLSELQGDTKVQAQLFGSMDLAALSSTLDLKDFDIENGKLESDISLNANKSAIVNKRYESVDFKGQFKLNDLSGEYKSHPMGISSLDAVCKPEAIYVSTDNITIKDSDFSGDVNILNPLALMSSEQKSKISLKGTSKQLAPMQLQDILMESESNMNASGYNYDTKPSIPETAINYKIERLSYPDQDMRDIELEASFNDDELLIKNSALVLNGDKMSLNGRLNNVYAFVSEEDTLRGELLFNAKNFDFNKFSSTNSTSTSDETSQVILIPDNIAIDIIGEIGKLKYNKLILKNITGKINISDQTASLLNTSAGILEGRLALEGRYDCSKPEQPMFDFRYDLSQVSFDQLFASSTLFSKLAPFAEYIEGGFNSTLVMSGPIGNDMMPIIDKITASGVLETLKTKIDGFPAFKSAVEKIGLNTVKDWYIRDSRNWFDIKDGVIDIKPYNFQLEDLNCKLSGNFKTDKTMALVFGTSIPRNMISENALGNKVNTGIDYLNGLAKNSGVDIFIGPNIDLDIVLTGSLSKPELKIIPKASSADIKTGISNKINEEKEKIEDQIKDKTEEIKTEVKDSVEKVIKEKETAIKTELEETKDTIAKEIKTKIQEELDSQLINIIKDTSVTNKLEKIIPTDKASEIDSIKSKLSNWNPFKKKKKQG